MNFIIGDIGNTNTKICLIEFKTFKINKFGKPVIKPLKKKEVIELLEANNSNFKEHGVPNYEKHYCLLCGGDLCFY